VGYIDFLKRVIDGNWRSKEEGYVVYTPSKEIKFYKDISKKKDLFLATTEIIENLLFESCLNVIENFAESDKNNKLYAIVLYIDTEGGCNGLSFNTEDSYRKLVYERYQNYGENDLTSIYGVRYNEGDFAFRYFADELDSTELHEVMAAYYSIKMDHPINDVNKPIAFHKSFFESQLIQIGLNVVNRLKDMDLSLNTTEDFIFYVSLHDVDEETIVKLMRKTVPDLIFDKLFPKYKD
jgi:hypothetical protein